MNILIGGAAGQGMETIAHLLGKALARAGFGVLTAKDYMSRVRGGHNFTFLRIAADTPWMAAQATQLLVALNEETYSLHRQSLTENSKIIYDPDLFSIQTDADKLVPLPLESLSIKAGNKIMANTVAVGAVLALLGQETSIAETLLLETFNQEQAAQNIAALRSGHNAAEKYCHDCFSLPQSKKNKRQLYLDGNQALGMSALASGCRFLAAYPMTPSTGIMAYLAAKQESHDVVVEQAEDEIAAVNMALGAAYCGARALTCTSGGGFSLMVEGVSLAGMTETPLVIIMAMRPGPATGLPTRTEQGDLEFVLHAGHGEFPRAILSATHIEDAFFRLNKAFNLAEKYQIPVIFLSDQHFADTARTVLPFDFNKLSYDRHLPTAETLETPYRRYRYTASGVSPRALPGQFPNEIVLADSDEHDEDGHIIEDAETRRRMTEKRLRKLEGLAQEMEEPHLFGDQSGELLLIGWGSTYGALKEACTILQNKHIRTGHLHFADLWPLPTTTIKALFSQFRQKICLENNATGQFSALLRRETGLVVDREILKFDGRPFFADEIVREVERHV